MNMLPDQAHRRSRCKALILGMGVLTSACAAPPLDDATNVTIRVATDEDKAMLKEALYLQAGSPHDWPKLRISFETRRILIEDRGIPHGTFYLCERGPSEFPGFLGSANILWHNRLLSNQDIPAIQAALQESPAPLQYEFVVPYAYRNMAERSVGENPTILPLPEDACFALHRDYRRLTMGRPLRIKKEKIMEVLGPLPRRIPRRQ